MITPTVLTVIATVAELSKLLKEYTAGEISEGELQRRADEATNAHNALVAAAKARKERGDHEH